MFLKKTGSTESISRMNLDSHWDKVLAEKENGGPESNDPGSKVTVNWRLLIISGIVVAGLFTTLAFWHHRQIKLHSAVLLSRALEAQDAEDWETAADWLSRYVRYVPDDVERVLDLASQVHEKARKREEFERALRLYRAYLEMRPEDDDVRAEIAKILLVFNPSQAVEHANRILASDPRHVNALRIRAVGMDRLFTTDGSNEGGKLVRVVQAYRRLLERSPDDVENAYRLATICWQYTDRLADGMSISPSHVTELADQVMDRLVKEKPNDVAARMTRFEYRLRFHSERGQPDDTKLDEDLRVVLDMEPGNGMALSAAGVHFAKSQPGDLIHVDRLEIARKFLRRAVSNQPNSDLPYLVLGRVAWALGDHNEATSAVESGLRSNRESMALLVTLAEFQIGLQQWENAWDTVSQLSELITSFRRIIVSPEEHWTLNFRYAQAGVLRARWYLHSRNPKRDPSAAARIVDNLIDYPIPLTFTSKVFQDLGVLCTASGKWEESVVVFKNATAVAPKAVSPRIQLITALSRVGQIKEAVAECRQLTEWDLHPHYQSIVWFDYTQLLLELELSKPRSEWLWDEFDKALAQLKRIEGDRPNVVLLELDAQNVRRGAASESAVASELRDFEGEFDDSELFWRGAAGFYLRFGLAEDANRAISKLEQLSGNLGITQQGRQNIVDASGPELINGDSDQDALNRAKQFDSEYRQALQEQRIRDAFRILRDWRHQLPASLQPKAELMKLARRLSRSGKHQDLEEGLRVLEGEASTLSRLAKIQRLLNDAESGHSESLREAADLASSWVESQPDMLPARLAAGMVNESRGWFEDAIEDYQFVFDRGDRRLALTKRLVALSLLEDRIAEAGRFLTHLTTRQKCGPALLPLVVELTIRQGDPDEAVDIASHAISLWPRNVEAHVMHGRALLARGEEGDLGDAEAAFARAVTLAPADVSVLIAAIHFHLQSPGPIRTHMLESYVRRACALIDAYDRSPSAWGAFVVARCLQLQGAISGADAFYRKSVKSDTAGVIRKWIPNGSVVTLTTSPVATELTDPVVWASGRSAYQTLGLLEGILGGLAEAQRIGLLDDDLRLQALVTLGRADKNSIATALRLMNQIPDSQLSSGDQMLKAELHRRRGQFVETLRFYRAAMRGDLSVPDLQTITDFLLRHDAVTDAGKALDRLDTLGISDVSTFALRLRWLAARKKTRQLMRVAEDTIRRATGTDQRIARARVAADVLAGIGQLQHAQDLLEFACRRHPYPDLVMASWLSSQPHGADKALMHCSKLADAGQLQQAASLAVLCLQHAATSDDITARTEKLVTDVLSRSKPVSAPLLANLSRLREIQGRIDEAITFGNGAMRIDPRNPVLQNNMAWYMGAYKKRYESALRGCDEAIRTMGPLNPFLDTKGVILLASGRPDEAIQLLETATIGAGAASTIYLHLAAAYQAAGRTADARLAFQASRQESEESMVPFDKQLANQLRSQFGNIEFDG